VLANAIASCPGTAAGTTLVTTSTSTYLVTSYANPQQASQAVAAALNTHVSLAAGLMDAVRRVTIVDRQNR
jgi:DNA/RNA-binding domain of Phe-tRNA-synthetase-like protein